MKWERINDDTERMLVPGGWIVRTIVQVEIELNVFAALCVAMVFVRDEGHRCEWTPGVV